MKYFLILFFVACSSPEPEAVIVSAGSESRTASTCLPDADPSQIVDGCGSDPRNYVPMSALYFDGDEMPSAHRYKGDSVGLLVKVIEGRKYFAAEGHSNAVRVFMAFADLLSASALDDSRLRFINNAQGGMDLQDWVAAGVGTIDLRVQVVLLHHSLSKNFDGCDSAAYVDSTRYYLKRRLLQLRVKYPRLRQVFLQSREYGGWKCYAQPGASAEPAAHRNGYAVKSSINLQVQALDTDLSYDNAPFLAWSFNPWDPTTPRSWFEGAGLHPCTTGANFWAQQWFDFLLNDSTTRSWFAANP